MQANKQHSENQLPEAEVVLLCGETDKHFELRSGEVCRIGRTADNAIELPTDNVSRNHAIIQANGSSAFCIFDLGSRNGTYVNGRRITGSTPLRNGDVIAIASHELVFIQSVVPQPHGKTRITPAATVVERPVNEITVAVADIRGYTQLCRQLGEVRVAEIMHAFNTEAGAVLAKLNAWGVKYMGDAVMAIWVNRGPSKKFLFTALSALSSLMEIAAGLQQRCNLESPVEMVAAINVGMASIGNMGSNAAPDYTALGDVVNKVFRLEDCAGDLRADLIMSQHVYRALQAEIDAQQSMMPRKVQLKGYADPELVYPMDKRTLCEILQRLSF